jgi:hypothetical protein
MRIPDYPQDEAIEAIETLASLRWLFEQDGDPVGSALADDALDHVATELHRSGLLDILVTRAANRYWPRWFLAHSGHPWGVVAVAGFSIFATVGQLLDHQREWPHQG